MLKIILSGIRKQKTLLLWLLALATIISLSATYQPNNHTIVGIREAGEHKITAPVPGTIQAIHVSPGEQVTKGQLLATLNGATTSQLHAPVSGTIKLIQHNAGATVAANAVVMIINDPNTPIIKGFVHESVKGEINVGEEFLASAFHDGRKSVRARVTAVSPRITRFPDRLQPLNQLAYVYYGQEITLVPSAADRFKLGELLKLGRAASPKFWDSLHWPTPQSTATNPEPDLPKSPSKSPTKTNPLGQTSSALTP